MMRRFVAVVGGMALATACSGLPEGSPAALYADRCARCHGRDMRGKPTAPPLVDLDRHWTGDGLIRYLRDPGTARRGDARLESQSARYLIDMPAYDELTDEQLEKLAAYLLDETGAR